MSDDGQYDDGLGELTPSTGPWSFPAVPADAEFIDFGPLKLPMIAGLQALVELDKKSRKVGAVSVQVNRSQVQLQVIAAPRGQRYWSDVRRKVVARLRKSAGSQQAIEGRFGTETIAIVTGRREDGILADATMRILGVDGDRWVLRAVVTGPDVTSDATVERVNALISRCAVARGTVALGAGTVLELSPPPGIAAVGGAPTE